MSLKDKIKTYYYLAKPGIVYGNSLSLIAGFFLGSQNFSFFKLVFSLLGLGLVMGGACVLNNIWDAEIDAKMERTSKRALVVGKVKKLQAFLYASFLLLVGSLFLYLKAGNLALLVSWFGVFVYVLLYTPLKRLSVHSTLVGAISGAVPPVVGYAASAMRLDLGALIIFLILLIWQMPHFYAIGIFRLKDYAAAALPVLSVKSGAEISKAYILAYIFLFMPAVFALYIFGYAGIFYLLAMTVVSVLWLFLGLMGVYKPVDEIKWAKRVFLFSLVILLVLCVIIPVDKYLNKIFL